jgi:hypothetical protein
VAGYTFDGFDGQESAGHNDHCLTRWAISGSAPLEHLLVAGPSLLPQFRLDAAAGVDRVDYTVNGTVIGTVYGPPFDFALDPAEIVGTPGLALDANRIVALGYDEAGELVASTATDWRAWFDGIFGWCQTPRRWSTERPARPDHFTEFKAFTRPRP